MPENENELNLEWELNRLDKELDGLLNRIGELQEDLEVIAAFASQNMLIGQIRQYTTGVPSAKPALKAKCLRFLERHGSIEVP